MTLAARLGIAPRRLWGWEPATVTEHHYDDAGRLSRTVARPEPEFDTEQYGLMAALADLEADTCSSCGQPMSECMSADSDPDNRDASHSYVADLPNRCFATTARELRAKQYQEAPVPQALRYPVRRVRRASPH